MRLPHGADLPLPSYQTAGSVAVDLYAALDSPLTLAPGGIGLVPSGLAIALPDGFEAQIHPRSGLVIRHSISLPNTPATIDSDYRGELKIPLINLGGEPVEIVRGMRIAQMLVARVPRIHWDEVEELPASERGSGGFGHTGE